MIYSFYFLSLIIFTGAKKLLVETKSAGQDEIFSPSSSEKDKIAFLFWEDMTRDVADEIQCKQRGVEKCRAVGINYNYLKEQMKPGDSIQFLPGLDITLKLQRDPTRSRIGSESYSFDLAKAGEATVTVGNTNRKVPTVFASIHPYTENVTYHVESCGKGCNVLYERDIHYFNQFED